MPTRSNISTARAHASLREIVARPPVGTDGPLIEEVESPGPPDPGPVPEPLEPNPWPGPPEPDPPPGPPARNLWPGVDPLGQTLLQTGPGSQAVERQVVGVVKDAQLRTLGQVDSYYVYFPGEVDEKLLVKSRMGFAATADAIRGVVRALDPGLPVPVYPLEANVDRWQGISGIVTSLAASLGALALVLASVGIFGVVAYFVSRRFREIDLLLVDDVQFLKGKEGTQEEFFHTFNAIYEAGRQVVLTSDRPPKEIPGLESRLVSRFEWGMVANIDSPDLEHRIAILRKKASLDHLELTIPDEVIDFIAQHVKSSVRELEGSIIKLLAYSSLKNQEITVSLARQALTSILRQDTPAARLTPEHIRDLVARRWSVRPDALTSKRRTKDLTIPRQVAMYVIKHLLDTPLVQIGDIFGGRDHSTVIHSVDKVERQVIRYNQKRRRPGQRANGGAPDSGSTPLVPGEEEPVIVKIKQFPVKPMAPEDAVLQLELVGHDFFVFRNADTDEINVVYRRKDGNYGLIEPQ